MTEPDEDESVDVPTDHVGDGLEEGDASSQSIETAAEAGRVDDPPFIAPTDYGRTNLREGDELVRRQDHEQAVKQAMDDSVSSAYWKGKCTERERVRGLIDQLEEKYLNGKTPYDSHECAALDTFCQELRGEVASSKQEDGVEDQQ